MKCPIDHTTLVMTERHGVEIDYCPTCRGVWLDRGELDKIIEQAVPPMATPEPAPAPREYREPQRAERPREWREPYREERGRDERERDREKYYRKKRRKSFLEEIFDFD